MTFEQQYGSGMGYHASSLENFHSILWNGLDTKYSKKDGLFGEGTCVIDCEIANTKE